MAKKTIAKEGREVQVHYKGTFEDVTVFDSSYDRVETINFTVGAGMMIPGFDTAVSGMRIGEVKSVQIAPEQAYGPHNEEAVQSIDKQQFPEDFSFETGIVVEGQVGDQPIRGIINSIDDDSVTVDFNHPIAGKNLNFEIELVHVM